MATGNEYSQVLTGIKLLIKMVIRKFNTCQNLTGIKLLIKMVIRKRIS